MHRPSKKRRRVLTLAWMVRNGVQPDAAREALRTMGLDERGIAIRVQVDSELR